MENIFAAAPMHRWIGGMTDYYENEKHLYEAKPGYRYQTDYTYGEHFSILDDRAVASLVEQVRQGARLASIVLHHFTDRHTEAVQFLLVGGGIDSKSRITVQHLAFVAYNHLNHYGNIEIAELILAHLLTTGYTKSDLLYELEYYHGYEQVDPEYLDEFNLYVDSAERRNFAKQLAGQLLSRAAAQNKKLKI